MRRERTEGRPASRRLYDIENEDGDVVAPSIAIGCGYEFIDCFTRGLTSTKDNAYLFVGHLVDQSIGTQQVALTMAGSNVPGVYLDFGVGAEGARHDVALWVAGRLPSGDLSGSFEFGDEAVVDRHLRELAVLQEIEPAISDVRSAEVERAGLSVAGSIEFGESYSQTLRRWHDTFNARWHEIADLGFDDRFRRMWNFYLTSCAATFHSGNCDVTQITVTRPS